MSTNSNIAQRKNSYRTSTEPPFYAARNNGFFLTAARGTICVTSATPLGAAKDSNWSVILEVRDGSGILLATPAIVVVITDFTAVYNSLGVVEDDSPSPGTVLQASIPLTIVYRHFFEKVPTVELTAQNNTGGSVVIPLPVGGAPSGAFGIIDNALFVLQGSASTTGFTASSVVTLITDGSIAEVQGLIGLLLTQFCLHTHSSTETRIL
jgi:hypothetical protein